MKTIIETHRSALIMVGLWAALGCSSEKQAGTNPDGGGAGGTPMPPPPPPFAPVQPASYVAKVKNVLLGLPPTDAEVQQVVADPSSFKTLVTGWMQQPQYTEKMKRFFELAFQQTQVTAVDFADQFYPKQIDINASTTPLVVQNAQESFARTMLQHIADGHPLSEAATTNQLMMTTALKEMYAFLDVWEVDDAGKVTDRFKQANPGLMITVEASQGSILIKDTLDPTNTTSYMHWYDPDVTTANMAIAGCTVDPLVYPASAVTLHYLLYGSLDGHKNPTAGGANCPPVGGTAAAPQLSAATDFSDWMMVTLREPAMNEAVTKFYDLPTLRTATELVLSVPRVGFFSTPAFAANWQTNISNQMRVTMNQTLIVALGAQVDGSDTTSVPGNPPPGLNAAHATGPCFVCHQTLDPLRSILASSWSWNYHNQLEAAFAGQKGLFAFHGVITPVSSIGDMGQALGQHPLFAPAWVQKLCTYVNSAPCVENDPEFQRLVGVFQGSTLSWNALVAELVTSPIVTNASETQTAATNGEVVAVARRDHLCAALNNRLGLTDVCGLDAVTKKQAQMIVPQIAAGLPSDGYGRGATMPVLPNAPTLFYRAGTENICEAVAAQVIDVAAAKQVMGTRYWSSTAPDAAIADFVSTVMGLVASDPRAAPATSLLSGHFAAAMQQGATASDALKSTFVTACLAPSAVSIGL
jgi:hypothetical protein